MLDKRLAHNPQFLNLARKLLSISEEKVRLAVEMKEFHLRHAEQLQALNSLAERAVEEFNLFYKEPSHGSV